MKYEILPESCRVCLRKCKRARSLYEALDDGDKTPYEMIRKMTGLESETEEMRKMLPRNICKNCELSLNLAFQFRLKMLKSQKIIQIYCKHSKMKRLQVVRTVITRQDDCVEDIAEQSYDDSQDQEHLQVSEEDEDDEMLEHEGEQVEEFEEVEVKVEEQEEETDVKVIWQNYDEREEEFLDEAYPSTDAKALNEDVLHFVLETESDGTAILKADSKDSSIAAETIEKPHKTQSPTKTKISLTANTTTYNEVKREPEDIMVPMRKVRAGRKSSDNGEHICDICGNIYSKRGRMMEHRRRHDKELRYACE